MVLKHRKPHVRTVEVNKKRKPMTHTSVVGATDVCVYL